MDTRHVCDPLGQTHSPASSDHYSHLKVVLFCAILKSGLTENKYENSDHYRPCLVDQFGRYFIGPAVSNMFPCIQKLLLSDLKPAENPYLNESEKIRLRSFASITLYYFS